MTKPMADKVALVTGGSSGIGRAMALAFAEEVAQAVIWLCSDKASLVVDAALAVDGGYLVV